MNSVLRPETVAAIMVDDHGTPEEQRINLVNELERHFTDPEKWPLTDEQRISFIKLAYQRVKHLRATEQAIAAAKGSASLEIPCPNKCDPKTAPNPNPRFCAMCNNTGWVKPENIPPQSDEAEVRTIPRTLVRSESVCAYCKQPFKNMTEEMAAPSTCLGVMHYSCHAQWQDEQGEIE